MKLLNLRRRCREACSSANAQVGCFNRAVLAKIPAGCFMLVATFSISVRVDFRHTPLQSRLPSSRNDRSPRTEPSFEQLEQATALLAIFAETTSSYRLHNKNAGVVKLAFQTACSSQLARITELVCT